MPKKPKNGNGNGKRHATQQSVNSAIKSICDVMRRSNCAGAMKYVPELTWLLFLRILDERETQEADEAEALGIPFAATIKKPHRWRDWAAPGCALRQDTKASVWKFVHEELLPYLRGLKDKRGATPRQKVISQVMASVERSRIESEKNFLDVLDKVHEITNAAVDTTHVFTLSQVYEGLLLKMGEKGNDGGQFFTPREIIRVMVRVVDPQPGKTVYDPGSGTCGFGAQSYEYMKEKAERAGILTGPLLEILKRHTFYGREKDDTIYPIALANLILHGVDEPHLWHGNTLSGVATYDDLFAGAPQFFDYVLMNPPFGGKEGKEAQTQFEYKTGATQVLFLQHVLKSMKAAASAASSWTKASCSAPTKSPLSKPSASSLRSAALTALSASPAASSQPPVLVSKRISFSSPKASRPSGYGTMTFPTSRLAKRLRSPRPTLTISLNSCRNAPTALEAGPSTLPRACRRPWRKHAPTASMPHIWTPRPSSLTTP